jgi:glucokinase
MRNALGIDIGGTGVKAARVSAAGAILAEAVLPTAPSAAKVLADVDALIARLDADDVVAIGVGVPGRVNARTGEILSGGYVDLSGPPLGARLGRTRGRLVFNDNDANMALVAEHRLGAARGFEHVVMLTIGTGIGGALMEAGRIVHGRGSAGQLGHIGVELDGAPCNCGRRGCFETTSAGAALGRLIAAAGFPAATAIQTLLAGDDARALALVERWALTLRAGLDTLAAAFDPETIVLGGGLGAAAVDALRRAPARAPWFQCAVAPARLGPSAGVVGAALAALELAS